MKQRDENSPTVYTYRFHDHGALAILNTGGQTVYMTPKETRQLARDLARLARDLERQTFLESDYGTRQVRAGLQIC